MREGSLPPVQSGPVTADADAIDFALEEVAGGETPMPSDRWRILIVDDEPAIHTATKLVLVNYEYEGKRLEVLSAYSAKEAKEVLAREHEIALLLLDVVMEHDHAGLDLVDYIRNELDLRHLRIIIRTGQPGLAPEDDVIRKYDIEGYRQKTELTVAKLHSTVTTGLRSYSELARVEHAVSQRASELSLQGQGMLDSLRFSKRIQSAILPSVDYTGRYFSKFYLFYKPKDIVAGDLYWFAQHGNTSVFANVDCTGHGVPGALLSIFIYGLLNQVVNQQLETNPALILQQLNEELLKHLEAPGSEIANLTKGFEANVLALNHDTHRLYFSSANRPLLHYTDGLLTEYAGDKHPVGDPTYAGLPFTLTEIDMRPKDRVFIFTDGLSDQRGSDAVKRFAQKRLKETLEYTQYLPLEDQQRTLLDELESWRTKQQLSGEVCFISLQPL